MPNARWSSETCVLVNNNSCRKLFSSLESPATFDQISKVTSVPVSIPYFDLLSCELVKFSILHLKFYIETFYIDCILKQNKILKHAVANSHDEIHSTFTVPCKLSYKLPYKYLVNCFFCCLNNKKY